MRIDPIAEATPLARTERTQDVASIGSSGGAGGLDGIDGAGSTEGVSKVNGDVSFGDIFAQAIQQANQADAAAAQKVDGLARGVNDDLHGTMIAVKEADISIKLVGTIRNKLLDAFNEVWKTSV
jgi:flagellar hook-basal body complex protein FliE